ncbi:hypothetical protein EDEG_02080 [Edhazardia aedis USNM 41457]|uniref:Uncharacterized protein n=1 Tax=Edhazardia aedis (strain USNM 41457) TaxID=1003232 RepID=J9DLY0_EDHAE|nr:hypothetical protein EDEG_02080 [Edhazardia aedis USNM 41457]|eukprot:EJW03590.1 hypothetical protein EDEG_02080 [Edhazardia aedis USNM 41457]
MGQFEKGCHDIEKQNLSNINMNRPLQIHIIPDLSGFNSEIPHIYNYLEMLSYEVILSQPERTVCPMKLDENTFYYVMCPICQHDHSHRRIIIHNPQNFVLEKIDEMIRSRNNNHALETQKKTKIEKLNILSPKSNSKVENTAIDKFEENALNLSFNNADNTSYFSKKEAEIEINEDNFKGFANIQSPDLTTFLISRLAQVEKSKGKKIFNIIFTSYEYKELAKKVEEYILKSIKASSKTDTNKCDVIVYLTFLMDVSYERLIAIDNVEVIILIDCPYFFPFKNYLLVPLLTPFDIFILFGKWLDGKYFPNKIDFDSFDIDIYKNKETAIVLRKSQIVRLNEYLPENKIISVPYYIDNKQEISDNIDEGLTGIASEYQKEGNNPIDKK